MTGISGSTACPPQCQSSGNLGHKAVSGPAVTFVNAGDEHGLPTSDPFPPPTDPSLLQPQSLPPLQEGGLRRDLSLPPLSTAIPVSVGPTPSVHVRETWPVPLQNVGLPLHHSHSLPGTNFPRLDGGIRQRVAVACVYCRGRKIRCIGHPGAVDGKCQNCARRGCPCVFANQGGSAAFIPVEVPNHEALAPQGTYHASNKPKPVLPGHAQPPARPGFGCQGYPPNPGCPQMPTGGRSHADNGVLSDQHASPAPATSNGPSGRQWGHWSPTLGQQRPAPAGIPLVDADRASIMRLSSILEADPG
ncbi:hypothetical protein FALCPG4_015314 [Fusarium falciforme]